MADRESQPPCIAISGTSGLMGSALLRRLTGGGNRVVRLVRDIHEATPGSGPVLGDGARSPQEDSGRSGASAAEEKERDTPAVAPWHSQAQAARLAGVNAVVHLAGKPIAQARWSADVKRAIGESRIAPTRQLCQQLATLPHPPKTLLCASAIGIYGDRGDQRLQETTPPGDGFLADVAQQWEAACEDARRAGIRVVNLRFGIVLSTRGGALPPMLTPARLGLGGPLGSGRQWWSWIGLEDAVGAIEHALETPSLSGPINIVAPHPVTQAEFAKTLGAVLRRPAVLPAPALALRVALGEMADALLLASQRVEPCQLLQSEYRFRCPQLRPCLEQMLRRSE